jgi:hypothetical protein
MGIDRLSGLILNIESARCASALELEGFLAEARLKSIQIGLVLELFDWLSLDKQSTDKIIKKPYRIHWGKIAQLIV